MRLSTAYRNVIKTEVRKVFGEDAQVFLFGSRVDDSKKGGDIDLFIATDDKDDLFQKKLLFLAKLKRALGEQKIDVVFNEDSERLVEQEIRKWAVLI
ncbi:MAG: nucleotidyltransferase domain-containing protein [Methylococcaceae bacterium]|nr:MAG: nucleotidyltransferase domain-containing protein [Methylococcaceae bacterium]